MHKAMHVQRERQFPLVISEKIVANDCNLRFPLVNQIIGCNSKYLLHGVEQFLNI